MDTMLWRLIAAGFLNTLLGYMVAVTNNDSRVRLVQENAFCGRLIMDAFASLGFVVPQETITLLQDLIEDVQFGPRIITPDVPFVGNARVVDGTLTADVAPEGGTTLVYQWDYVRFNLLGSLSEHSQPGVGIYVLVNKSANGDLGLPSLYLTIA